MPTDALAPASAPTPPAQSRPVGPLALLSALDAELSALRDRLETERVERVAGRELHLGRLHGVPVVMALSGIGKVAAAATSMLLIERYAPRALLFTGVAGGIAPGVQVGDVVVADALLQHDLDASPLFPRYEVPLTGRSRFATDVALSTALATAAAHAQAAHREVLAAFGCAAPRVHRGLVISGDRFVATTPESDDLRRRLPEALAVEMEGAAVAQVCHDAGLPCAVIRTISDRADDAAHVDFGRFLDEVSRVLCRDVVAEMLVRS